MARNNVMSYPKIIAELKKHIVHPAYFIFGEENYLIDDLIENIGNVFIGKPQKEINTFIRYANETPLDELLALTAGGGLFSDKKLIIYKDFQLLRNPEQDDLLKYLAHPAKENCLIIVARIDNANQSRYHKIQELAVPINAMPLKQDDLKRMVQKEFQHYGRRIDTEAIDALLYFVGDKIHDLKSQIQQIVNGLPHKDVITSEDIESFVGAHGNQNIFELTRAIAQRKIDEALFILNNLLEKGENPIGILHMLIRHLSILWKIKGFKYSNENNKMVIQKKLGLYPKYYTEYESECKQWSHQQLQNAMQVLKACDVELKSANLSEQVILDRLVFQLVALK
jgi:DNA polymerase-3 subunit delta